ncbi:MAG: hypothetical protein Tsb009_37930 [Planctomycetaceae bacterium]
MRTLTGAILLVGAEQAFSHAHTIGYPHTSFARQILIPASGVFLLLGLVFLLWGVVTERSTSAAGFSADGESRDSGSKN